MILLKIVSKNINYLEHLNKEMKDLYNEIFII